MENKTVSKSYKWQFKARFRRGIYGWRGTALASKRLKEAVSEIKKVRRSDPVLAGEGCVGLMERLWPALDYIDTSSGTLGNAVYRTLEMLTPILIEAPADKKTRRIWLERLYEAVANNGVGYLDQVEDCWGEVCGFPNLVNEWADELLPLLRDTWLSQQPGQYIIGTAICLSCLLEAKRYDELKELLSFRTFSFWSYDMFWAEALKRQGKIDEAIAYAESRMNYGHNEHSILEFCEQALLKAGRNDEAYDRYGLSIRHGWTYLSQYKSIVKKHPERNPRQILLDIINRTENKASWFASARQAEFLDIAKDCALSGLIEPETLIRAARDTTDSEPEFAAVIALRAIDLLLQGYGYETTTSDTISAFKHLMKATKNLRSITWAIFELKRLINREPPNYDKVSQKVLINFLNKHVAEVN